LSTVDARGPLAVTRRATLLQALQEHGTLRVSELADILAVTPVTIRRDIAHLAGEGLVHRVHGGATLARASDESAGQGQRTPVGDAAIASVGMLVPSLHYYWPGVVRGAEEEATERDLRIVLRGSSYESDDTWAQLKHLIEQAAVSGLVLAPNMEAQHTTEALQWLSGTGVPVTLVERSAAVGSHHGVVESVVSDHALGAALAVRHLASLGHRKVGLVVTHGSPTSPHIRTGWLAASAECACPADRTVDATIADSRDPGWTAAIDRVLDECLSTGTMALLVHADAEAIALVQRCQLRGLRVPEDLSVVAYDDEVASLFSPALTAVRPPRRSLGRAAVGLVAERMADPGRPGHRVIISPSLRVRDSSAPPKA
jgi:DNA-binding LacI/PurR family transcriptional regulator